MFTVCPKCTLTLVVTTVDLRAGQGYVRCGRCANVFNALIALREGDPSGNISDSAKRRLLETAPSPPVQPAHGSGVEMDAAPEPEPAREPVPEPQPEPGPELEPDQEPESDAGLIRQPETASTPEPVFEPDPAGESIELSSDEESMEFDAAATDVSEIFISPPEAEHDTASGNYEAVVLAEEPQPAPPAPEPAFVAQTSDDPLAHTISSGDWSLSDEPSEEAEPDMDLLADAAPREAAVAEESAVAETASADDPAWVEEMFAEAEAEAERVRTAERQALDYPTPDSDTEPDPDPDPQLEPEPETVDAAPAPRAAPRHDDAAIAPLLTAPEKFRPSWQYIGGIAVLALFLAGQLVHHNRQSLVLSNSLGPAVATVYGWFGVTLVPRWDLAAYSVKQLGAEAEGAEGTRLRVRLSLQNESARVQPLPLLRLTLQDRYGKAVATRDLEPHDYLPKRVVDQRLLEPDQRIDAELHVIDPGKAAIGFEIDACLRTESGRIGCANEARRRASG